MQVWSAMVVKIFVEELFKIRTLMADGCPDDAYVEVFCLAASYSIVPFLVTRSFVLMVTHIKKAKLECMFCVCLYNCRRYTVTWAKSVFRCKKRHILCNNHELISVILC